MRIGNSPHCIRIVALLATALLAFSSGPAQTQGCPCKDEDIGQVEYAVSLVQSILHHPEMHTTWGEKRLARIGDRAGIALLKLYTEQQMQDKTQLTLSLSIVRGAFSDPCEITVPVDKRPDITVFLLQSLGRDALNEGSRGKIQETTEFVQKAASKKCPKRPN